MRHIRIILMTFMLSFAFASKVVPQWVQTNGPYGGYITAFAVGGEDIFAGTSSSGVFHSNNGGRNWEASNTRLTNPCIHALAINGTNLLAGTDGGIFLSTNNGAGWTAINSGLTETSVQSLAVSGINIFAGTLGGGAFRSTNNGNNWTPVDSGFTGFGSDYVACLAVSMMGLLAGTKGSGIFCSTDNGASWTAFNYGLPYQVNVQAIGVSGVNLFAATDRGVFFFTSRGLWAAVDSGLTTIHVKALATNSNSVFAGTDCGVFLSTNNGSSITTN